MGLRSLFLSRWRLGVNLVVANETAWTLGLRGCQASTSNEIGALREFLLALSKHNQLWRRCCSCHRWRSTLHSLCVRLHDLTLMLYGNLADAEFLWYRNTFFATIIEVNLNLWTLNSMSAFIGWEHRWHWLSRIDFWASDLIQFVIILVCKIEVILLSLDIFATHLSNPVFCLLFQLRCVHKRGHLCLGHFDVWSWSAV